jgi:hypothetical protein
MPSTTTSKLDEPLDPNESAGVARNEPVARRQRHADDAKRLVAMDLGIARVTNLHDWVPQRQQGACAIRDESLCPRIATVSWAATCP